MSSLLPVAVYGLKVPAGDVLVPANIDFPATFRITMAAIDPSAKPEHNGAGAVPARATLKIIYDPNGPGEDGESDDDAEDEDYLKGLLEGAGSDEDDEEDEFSDDDEEEEKNGGPSDPSKSKKARKQAAVEQMMKALAENDSDDEMDDVPAVNGAVSKKKKGKAKATEMDEESGDEDEDELPEMEELVLCTLDLSKNYQQPLDLTVGEDQRAFFKVSGTHAIYLTGNYVVPADGGHNHQHEVFDGEDDSEDYDLSPDEDEFDGEEESDDLDDLEDPRITELASDEEQAPKLVEKEEAAKKGKNKRAAEDSDEEPANLDDIMAKSLKPAEPITNGEPKLSKKQLKKLKNNAGKAVEAAVENKDVKKEDKKDAKKDAKKGAKKDAKKEEAAVEEVASPKLDKKVQFAKNLEQGPATAKDKKADAKAESKSETKKDGEKPKASLGAKVVQGVTIDDRELGKGPAAKKGNKVGMRYIGKLEDGKVFDANKKGKPFTFTLGTGEVIKGWDIGVAGMSVGGTRRITVPSSLAYGGKSLPGIPANSTLIFDIKMLEIH